MKKDLFLTKENLDSISHDIINHIKQTKNLVIKHQKHMHLKIVAEYIYNKYKSSPNTN